MKNNDLNRVSLVLNLLLVAMCVFFATRHRAQPPVPPAQTLSESALNNPASDSRTTAPIADATSKPVDRRPWVEILREQGVPANVIARLAIADFEDRWQSRQAQAQESYNRGDLDADGLAALAIQHDIEQENALRATLGEQAFRDWDASRLFQQFNLSNISLTTSETNSLYELSANHRQQLRDLEKARQDNEIDQATFNADQAKVDADFQKQVRTLLGDERYGALHGTDPAVGDLRRSLRGVDVNNQQFATLLEAQQQWDAARTQLEQQMVESGDTNLQQRLDLLAQNRAQTFGSVLGTNGLALLEKQQDSRYLELQKNAARWGLDSSNIDFLYATLQICDNATADYRRKVRDMDTFSTKYTMNDPASIQQPWEKYENDMAQYVRANLTESQYEAVSQILPFARQ